MSRQNARFAALGTLVLAAAAVFAVTPACPNGRFRATTPASALAANALFVPSKQAPHALVWAVGDGANGGSDAKKVAQRIEASKPDRFLYLGDVYEHGTASEFRNDYATVYGPLARITAPTPGNHDWPEHAQGYDPYWKRVTEKRVPEFYSFMLAGWQLLSLNSEDMTEAGSPQVRWLRREVRRPGTCRIAFWHRPRFSAGLHGDTRDVAAFWNALRGHATIVLSGHDHDMQRLKPRDGIVEFVSGAGGKSHYPTHRRDPRLAFANDTNWGALRLALTPGSARYAFVTGAGRTLDSGTISCLPLAGG